jgi:hypothetical protein
MPRVPRTLINDETTVYHVMSGKALDGFPLGDIEKDFMLDETIDSDTARAILRIPESSALKNLFQRLIDFLATVNIGHFTEGH